MPLFNYRCDGPCSSTVRRIFSVEKAKEFTGTRCSKPDCGGSWQRDPVGPSTHKKERLDNHVSPRAVERFDNAEELFKERSKVVPS